MRKTEGVEERETTMAGERLAAVIIRCREVWIRIGSRISRDFPDRSAFQVHCLVNDGSHVIFEKPNLE